MHQPKDAIYITTCISLKKKLSIFLSILFSLEFTCSLRMWVRTKQRDTQHLPGGVQNRLHKACVYCTTLSSCSPYSLFNPCGFNWLSSWNVLSLRLQNWVFMSKTSNWNLENCTRLFKDKYRKRKDTLWRQLRSFKASKPLPEAKTPTHSVKDTHITQHKDRGYNFILFFLYNFILPTLAWCQSYYSGCFLLI